MSDDTEEDGGEGTVGKQGCLGCLGALLLVVLIIPAFRNTVIEFWDLFVVGDANWIAESSESSEPDEGRTSTQIVELERYPEGAVSWTPDSYHDNWDPEPKQELWWVLWCHDRADRVIEAKDYALVAPFRYATSEPKWDSGKIIEKAEAHLVGTLKKPGCDVYHFRTESEAQRKFDSAHRKLEAKPDKLNWIYEVNWSYYGDGAERIPRKDFWWLVRCSTKDQDWSIPGQVDSAISEAFYMASADYQYHGVTEEAIVRSHASYLSQAIGIEMKCELSWSGPEAETQSRRANLFEQLNTVGYGKIYKYAWTLSSDEFLALEKSY